MSKKPRIVIKTNKGLRRCTNSFPGYGIDKPPHAKKKATLGIASTESSKEQFSSTNDYIR